MRHEGASCRQCRQREQRPLQPINPILDPYVSFGLQRGDHETTRYAALARLRDELSAVQPAVKGCLNM